MFGIVLAQPGEGGFDCPISFPRKILSKVKRNYTTTEREGLAIVYALQKFRNYLLGAYFKMYINHSTLKYLLNKPILGGKNCLCLLLFQEYNFGVVLKPERLNVRPNHFSRLETRATVSKITFPMPSCSQSRLQMITSHILFSLWP